MLIFQRFFASARGVPRNGSGPPSVTTLAIFASVPSFGIAASVTSEP